MSKTPLFGVIVGLLLVVLYGAYVSHQLADELRKTREQLERSRDVVASLRRDVAELRSKCYVQAKWTTRALLSETKRPDEMRVIAEVIRNRAETNWRGADSYRDVVLDPYQFSAFNPNSPRSGFYRSMDGESTPYPDLWDRAMKISWKVMLMPRDSMKTTLSAIHFTHYIEPSWTRDMATLRHDAGDRMNLYANPRIQTRN